jgi:hypothetical protein
MACTKPSNTFKTLGGHVPVHYDRLDPPFHYGSKGKQFTLAGTKSLENTLDDAFAELWDKCPLGKADIILTAGAFVCRSGQHGKGNAFDCDGIWWGDRLLLTKNYRSDAQAYLGVEAVLRKHIGTVLNFEYNASHEDHWHLDTGTKPGFSASSKSRVLFLQMALGKLFDRRVGVDGDIGDETRGAVRDVLEELGLATAAEMSTAHKTDNQLAQHWMAFLDAAAEKGLAALAPADADGGGTTADADPLQLLERLHDMLSDELAEHPSRKQIERAVENFADHPEIAAVLARFS